jgi:16S rRNA (guanine966-N2)-methyltransferase
MRVVAGSARGRRLVSPAGVSTRPTADRVRESMFNALHSLAVVEGATMVDLFAGSGALGIEALSRGAAFCTFVEPLRAALYAIRRNLAVTGLSEAARVVASSAEAYLAGRPEPVDVALCDPPYAYDGWDELLARLPAGFAVMESDRALALPEGWALTWTRRYGSTVVTFGRRVVRGT